MTRSQDSAATLITCYTLRLDYTTITTMHIILIMSCCKTQCTLTQDSAAHSQLPTLCTHEIRLYSAHHNVLQGYALHLQSVVLATLCYKKCRALSKFHSKFCNALSRFARYKYLTQKNITKTQGSLSCKPL